MPLTRDFRETVMARVKSDSAFRSELIVEATNAFLMDDMETGKALLCDYLNATESIADIARELKVNEKSLRRMLGPKGNLTLKNFLSLLKVCSSDRARAAVREAGLPFTVLDENGETTGGYVSVGTMPLAKGLEFRAVAVMACDDEVIPLQEWIETAADDTDLEEVYNTERHLLYVA